MIKQLMAKKREKGVLSLEFVGTFGVFLFLLAIAFQAMLAMFALSQANSAARNAARAEAMMPGTGPGAAQSAVSPGLQAQGVQTTCSGGHNPKGDVTCKVSLGVPVFNMPDAPQWFPEIRVTRASTQPVTG
ncbi:TadE/TadG family type IV pilus assembly protein [Brevibacterium paucivorans]